MRALLVGALMLVGCSVETKPVQPASCSPDQRVGTYMVSFVERSGSCGPVPDQLVSFNAADIGQNCELHSERYSEGSCKLERDITCQERVKDDLAWGGWSTVETRTTGVTKQVTADGSRIEGTATVSIDDGHKPCTSTYDIVAVRQ